MFLRFSCRIVPLLHGNFLISYPRHNCNGYCVVNELNEQTYDSISSNTAACDIGVSYIEINSNSLLFADPPFPNLVINIIHQVAI